MNYLYHMVPKRIEGNELMPLNRIKNKYPEIYKKEVKKYKGREFILERKIPKLNCLWNDVIHLTAVPPEEVKEALEKSGSKIKRNKWFKINPKLLHSKNTIVFLYSERKAGPPSNNDYIPFNIKDLSKYNKIGEKTLEYFKKEISEGRKPLIFHLVPHILYKGNLKIKDLEIVEI